MGKYKEIVKSLGPGSAALRSKIPGVYEGFAVLHRAAYADGALSSAHKELIAVGIAVRAGCDGCIASHVRAAVRRGVTAEEMAEAIGVAIHMGGGPSTIYATHAWEAFEEFSDSQPPPA